MYTTFFGWELPLYSSISCNASQIFIDKDSDDCLENSCPENSYCDAVVDGKVLCRCQPGYRNVGQSGEEMVCEDVDECREEAGVCNNPLSICSNKPGYYTCECQSGYYGNGGASCRDIDECLDGSDDCSDGFLCVNLPGRFRCQKIPGEMLLITSEHIFMSRDVSVVLQVPQ